MGTRQAASCVDAHLPDIGPLACGGYEPDAPRLWSRKHPGYHDLPFPGFPRYSFIDLSEKEKHYASCVPTASQDSSDTVKNCPQERWKEIMMLLFPAAPKDKANDLCSTETNKNDLLYPAQLERD